MFFALTDDQRDFAAAVHSYLAEQFDLDAVRAVVEDPAGDGHPAPLWAAMGEQGWLAVLVPEENDGLGLGMVEAQVIARELGAGVAPGPWRATVLAAEAIRLAGSPEQRAKWLPGFASGDAVGAVGLRGGSGLAPGVEYAEVADRIVVADGPTLYLLDPSSGGVTLRRQESYDGTTRLAVVEYDPATAEELPGSSVGVLAELTARAAVLVAADLVGSARQALDRTVAYDRDRKQFGVPVGSFQAIKHTLADLHIAVTMAEHAVLYAAHALDTADLSDPATQLAVAAHTATDLAVAVAKAKASDAGLAAAAAMIQYHGGIGYTWEHEAHFFYKRTKRLAAAYGDADSQRERIAALTM